MKTLFQGFLFFLIALNSSAFAEWSSGGGELIKDSHNPWFVQNTAIVTYCIVIDGSSVGITEPQADSTIRQAIEYWQEEFSYSRSFDPQIRVATQTFNKIQCHPDRNIWADVTFQYGFLTQEQRDYLGDVRRFASIAVRTDYNRQALRGRGFLYFAAETGPDAPNDPRFINRQWSRDSQALLYWATVHELGHVFGLPHNAEYPGNMQIMSHRFVEHILLRSNSGRFPRDKKPRQFFQLRPIIGNTPEMACFNGPGQYLQKAKEFFGVQSDWKCLGTLKTRSGLEIWASESYLTMPNPTKVGTIRELDGFTLVNNAMMFWLPPGQNVFPSVTRVNTPSYKIEDISAEYVSESGHVIRRLGLSMDPRKDSPLFDDLKISGELDGRFYSNIIEGH